MYPGYLRDKSTQESMQAAEATELLGPCLHPQPGGGEPQTSVHLPPHPPPPGESASRDGSDPRLKQDHHLLFLVSQGPVHTGEYAGQRSKSASGTVPLWAFIISQEAELNVRPLRTFPARRELACRECSDHWDSRESWTPRTADRG